MGCGASSIQAGDVLEPAVVPAANSTATVPVSVATTPLSPRKENPIVDAETTTFAPPPKQVAEIFKNPEPQIAVEQPNPVTIVTMKQEAPIVEEPLNLDIILQKLPSENLQQFLNEQALYVNVENLQFSSTQGSQANHDESNVQVLTIQVDGHASASCCVFAPTNATVLDVKHMIVSLFATTLLKIYGIADDNTLGLKYRSTILYDADLISNCMPNDNKNMPLRVYSEKPGNNELELLYFDLMAMLCNKHIGQSQYYAMAEKLSNFKVLLYQDGMGRTLMHHAAVNDHLIALQLFTECSQFASVRDVLGMTPFHLAVQYNHLDVAMFLRDLDDNLPNNNQETPLATAIKLGHWTLIDKVFFDANQVERWTKELADKYLRKFDLFSLLMAKRDDIVHFLVEHQLIPADVFHTLQALPISIFHMVSIKPDMSILDTVLKYVTVPIKTIVDYRGQTPLHYAAEHGGLDIVRHLLLLEKDLLNMQDRVGRTALHLAIQNRHFKIVDFLLLKKPNVALYDTNGYSALHTAAEFKNLSAVEKILKVKPDLAGTSFFRRKVHLASPQEKRGLELIDKRGPTPLMICARSDWHHGMQAMLTANPDCANTIVDSVYSNCALHICLQRNFKAGVDMLLPLIKDLTESEQWKHSMLTTSVEDGLLLHLLQHLNLSMPQFMDSAIHNLVNGHHFHAAYTMLKQFNANVSMIEQVQALSSTLSSALQIHIMTLLLDTFHVNEESKIVGCESVLDLIVIIADKGVQFLSAHDIVRLSAFCVTLLDKDKENITNTLTASKWHDLIVQSEYRFGPVAMWLVNNFSFAIENREELRSISIVRPPPMPELLCLFAEKHIFADIVVDDIIALFRRQQFAAAEKHLFEYCGTHTLQPLEKKQLQRTLSVFYNKDHEIHSKIAQL